MCKYACVFFLKCFGPSPYLDYKNNIFLKMVAQLIFKLYCYHTLTREKIHILIRKLCRGDWASRNCIQLPDCHGYVKCHAYLDAININSTAVNFLSCFSMICTILQLPYVTVRLPSYMCDYWKWTAALMMKLPWILSGWQNYINKPVWVHSSLWELGGFYCFVFL